MSQLTAQEVMIEELLESNDDNEMIQVLEFLRKNGVPVTQDQALGMFMLQEAGLSDIALYVQSVRTQMTPYTRYFKMTDKLTLADRIKGNAKLGNLLKANANPANAAGVPMGIEKGVK
ncbi:hypothetical protein [Paenibacillus thiaminolyticus]|uniref:Uncharacterized protein n=1 Tax=Paenibacillus thiaminolyticus TaxID=49283 RepID=A0A3A3GJA3_PANTH|nr:hypothetical protein [Paenibacillus thiaminolyticus]RJG23296.1 hypothetical protein DQX05_13690 [Paenibacillus thiaminolyticus]RJG23313.1 hypothetical protein DQX05_13780 [Paenibacillus thiaminolyticus]